MPSFERRWESDRPDEGEKEEYPNLETLRFRESIRADRTEEGEALKERDKPSIREEQDTRRRKKPIDLETEAFIEHLREATKEEDEKSMEDVRKKIKDMPE